jgi:uncharacterized protein YjbI with pentapeptide repeats
MDRDEALELLKGGNEGIAEWNRRRADGETIPVLRWANLSRANLRGADLNIAEFSRADLSEADLGGANLSSAELSGANLRRANLSSAELSWAHLHVANLSEACLGWAKLSNADLSVAELGKADLRGTDLSGANLNGANLDGANLSRANLCEADLTRANLSGAVCGHTTFADVVLSDVKGLASIKHDGPSTIGIDTLIRSKGKIPEAFLRGCGVPDAWIGQLPALIGAIAPIQFYSCFISFNTNDQEFAAQLHSRMRDEGLRVWFASKDVQAGKKLHEQIDEAIRLYEKLVVVLSPHSKDSEWVKTEIRKARTLERQQKQRKLFPVGLMDYNAIRHWEWIDGDTGENLWAEMREYFIPDFSNWKDHDSFEAAFTRLLEDLKRDVAPAGPKG